MGWGWGGWGGGGGEVGFGEGWLHKDMRHMTGTGAAVLQGILYFMVSCGLQNICFFYFCILIYVFIVSNNKKILI